MAIYTILGTITNVSPIETITTRSGEPFSKRTVVITQRRFNPTSGEEYRPNHIPIEATKTFCQVLDNFPAGTPVRVTFALHGRECADQRTRETRHLVSLLLTSIERDETAAAHVVKAQTIAVVSQQPNGAYTAGHANPADDGLPF